MMRIVAIALGSFALAGMAGASAFDGWAGRFMPGAALAINRSSPDALTAANETAWAAKDKTTFKRIAKANALSVLKREPLSERALRQLGTYYVLTGQHAKGRGLVTLSTTVTKRDAAGQMWLAADSARLGRIDDALRAFDIVIRTQPEAREMAFTGMNAALADPRFRSAFVELAAKNPPWLSSFVAFAIGTSTRPSELADVLGKLRPIPKSVLPQREAGALLSRLVSEAPVENALNLYLSLPGSRRAILTTMDFQNGGEAFRYSPFGWQVFDNAGVQAFGSAKGANAMIEALVLPGYRGTAARKLLFLSPNTYRWTSTALLDEMAQGATAATTLSCYTGPGKWARVASAQLRNGSNLFDFKVPGNCRAQLLSLDLIGADNQNDSAMTLHSMKLESVSAK